MLKQKRRNKWSTACEPPCYTVIRTNGSSVAAGRITDGWEVYGDTSQFKITNALIQEITTEEKDGWE